MEGAQLSLFLFWQVHLWIKSCYAKGLTNTALLDKKWREKPCVTSIFDRLEGEGKNQGWVWDEPTSTVSYGGRGWKYHNHAPLLAIAGKGQVKRTAKKTTAAGYTPCDYGQNEKISRCWKFSVDKWEIVCYIVLCQAGQAGTPQADNQTATRKTKFTRRQKRKVHYERNHNQRNRNP